MKKESQRREPVSSKLGEKFIDLWHSFAFKNKVKKHEALEELIERGSKCIKKV